MRKKMTKVEALIMVAMISLAGCSKAGEIDVSKVQRAPMLTTQEVIDYYATEMSYDEQAKKRSNRSAIELNLVTDEKVVEKLAVAYDKVLAEFQKNDNYLIETEQHDYIKSTIDDMVLSYGEVKSIKEALGYYFMEVQYSTSPNSLGTFKSAADYLGINGVIIKDEDNNDTINKKYLKAAKKKLKTVTEEEKKKMSVETDEEKQNEPESVVESVVEGGIDGLEEATGSLKLSSLDTVRKLKYNISEFNKKVGSSKEQIAFMPNINMVYNVTESKGDMSGYGIYDGGNYGLKDFGYDRTKSNGTLSITYVFKPDFESESKFEFAYAYVSSYNSNNRLGSDTSGTDEEQLNVGGAGYAQDVDEEAIERIEEETADENSQSEEVTTNTEEQEVNTEEQEANTEEQEVSAETVDGTEEIRSEGITVPEFIKTELNKVLERADRATCNDDISALMSGNIFEDAGCGLLWSMYGENSNIVCLASSVQEVLARNTNTNSYLVKVERTTMDAGCWDGGVATYKDIYYMVIRQIGQEFKINDMALVKRDLVELPEPDNNAGSERRLAALNLAGDITEENKAKISILLDNWYSACTNRILDDGVDDAGNKIYGMYDRFDTDTTLLTEERKEYINSQIRNKLIKLGTNVGASYNGVVLQWVGGSEHQAELITEELIDYTGKDKGNYIQTYYLVSNYNGEWVIDDLEIIVDKEVEGAELTELQSRLGK